MAGRVGSLGNWQHLIVDLIAGTSEKLTIGEARVVSRPEWAGPNALIYARSQTIVVGSALPDPIVRFDLGSRAERILFCAPNLFPNSNTGTATTKINLLGDDELIFDSFTYIQTITEVALSSATRSVLTKGLSVDRQPSYSPDGSRLLFTSNRIGNVELFSYEFATKRLTQLTEHPASDWDGAYTPDGQSILWSSDRSGNLEIWMADADGTNPRQVNHDGVDAENPTMTADGDWVVYSSGNPENSFGLLRVRPDGSDPASIVFGGLIQPEVSPDGRYVSYVDVKLGMPYSEIRVTEIATGRVLDFTIRIDYEPQSPDVT